MLSCAPDIVGSLSARNAKALSKEATFLGSDGKISTPLQRREDADFASDAKSFAEVSIVAKTRHKVVSNIPSNVIMYS